MQKVNNSIATKLRVALINNRDFLQIYYTIQYLNCVVLFFMWKWTKYWLRKVMHSFEENSNESACRKIDRLGLEQVTWVILNTVYINRIQRRTTSVATSRNGCICRIEYRYTWQSRIFRASFAAPWTNRIHGCSVNNTCENFSPTFQTQFSATTITVNVEEFHNLKQ